MPALSNPKHERFAQELARGVSQQEAYVKAGYKAHASNPSSLARDKRILARVAEILAEREEIHKQATAQAINATALTKEWVIRELRDNANKAKEVGDFSPSNKALELLGKELGMFVDRSENVNTNVSYVVAGEPVEDVDEWVRQHSPN